MYGNMGDVCTFILLWIHLDFWGNECSVKFQYRVDKGQLTESCQHVVKPVLFGTFSFVSGQFPSGIVMDSCVPIATVVVWDRAVWRP